MSGRSKVFVGVCRCLMACDVSRGLMCSAQWDAYVRALESDWTSRRRLT